MVSVGFSALLALTLTPALCATFLKPHVPEDQRKENWLTRRTGRFFTGFNNWFGRTTDRYQGGVARILSRPLRWLAIFIALVGLRSEEHTSELQSLMRISYAVFFLKKNKSHAHTSNQNTV